MRFILLLLAVALRGAASCDLSPCANGGTCTGTTSSYTCSCSPEYTGGTCSDQVRFTQSDAAIAPYVTADISDVAPIIHSWIVWYRAGPPRSISGVEYGQMWGPTIPITTEGDPDQRSFATMNMNNDNGMIYVETGLYQDASGLGQNSWLVAGQWYKIGFSTKSTPDVDDPVNFGTSCGYTMYNDMAFDGQEFQDTGVAFGDPCQYRLASSSLWFGPRGEYNYEINYNGVPSPVTANFAMRHMMIFTIEFTTIEQYRFTDPVISPVALFQLDSSNTVQVNTVDVSDQGSFVSGPQDIYVVDNAMPIAIRQRLAVPCYGIDCGGGFTCYNYFLTSTYVCA